MFEELKPTNEMVTQLAKILSRCGNAKRVQKAFGTYLGEKAFQMYKDFFTVR